MKLRFGKLEFVTPKVTFHGQPFDSESTGGSRIAAMLEDEAIDSVVCVVAWARLRGLLRIRTEIEEFRKRGGQIRAVLGIDEGGATRPGLLGAIELFDDAHIFHDPHGGTFHPKVYLGEGDSRARLIVGSNNLTPGGLYVNVEAALETEFLLPDEADASALVAARAFVERIRSDENASDELTPELVERMMKDPRYRIAANEKRRARATAPAASGAEPEDIEEVGVTDEAGDAPIFRPSTQPRASAPALTDADREMLAALELDDAPGTTGATAITGQSTTSTSTGGQSSGGPAIPSGGGPTVRPAQTPVAVESWSKVLSRSDAQQTSPGTNPTGLLRLNQAGHAIDHRTWFRKQLFGSAVNWTLGTDSQQNPNEVAEVDFDVEIHGQNVGTFKLTIDHAPHREEGQNNVVSILHWDELSPMMRENDFTGDLLTIERLSDGSFRLRIESGS